MYIAELPAKVKGDTSMYYIGIDGGGTSSRLVAIDRDINILGHSLSGSTNITSDTYENVCANIKNLIGRFNTATNTKIEDCGVIFMGSAGAKVPGNAQKLENIFREAGFIGKLRVVSDAELVLAAETRGEPGIIVISGTGSACFAMDKQGNMLRTGGWGHLIDDGGSGYRIGMDAIQAALMDFDGRGKNTLLTDMIRKNFKLQQIDHIQTYIYGDDFNKSRIAEIVMLVKEASDKRDSTARAIEANATKSLICLARAMINKTGLSSHKLVISGSVITLYENIRENFCTSLESEFPNVKITTVSEKPEMGAAYLALKENG